MSKLTKIEQFSRVVDALTKAKNNRTDLETFAREAFSTAGINGLTLKAIMDYSAGRSPEWRERFNRAFSKEYFGHAKKGFEAIKALTNEQKEAVKETFAATVSEAGDVNIKNLIQTNILASLDGLFQEGSLLSQVQIIRDTESYRLPEYGQEQSADRVNENAGSTAKDDVPRDGDLLTASDNANKIRVSEVVSDLFIRSIKPEDYGIMQARLVRKMDRRFETEIITGSNASGQFAGYINATSGANAFGALETTLALSGTAGGVQDDVDAVKYLISDLPAEISDSQLTRWTLLMNRPTKWRLKRERDANGRTYDLNQEFDGLNIMESFAMPSNRVLIADLSLYYVLLAKPIDIEIRELDNEMFEVKSFTYADGGMRMGYKTLPDGVTANTPKNAFRYADLKADYSV